MNFNNYKPRYKFSFIPYNNTFEDKTLKEMLKEFREAKILSEIEELYGFT